MSIVIRYVKENNLHLRQVLGLHRADIFDRTAPGDKSLQVVKRASEEMLKNPDLRLRDIHKKMAYGKISRGNIGVLLMHQRRLEREAVRYAKTLPLGDFILKKPHEALSKPGAQLVFADLQNAVNIIRDKPWLSDLEAQQNMENKIRLALIRHIRRHYGLGGSA